MSPISQNSSLPLVKEATRLAMANRDLLEADGYLRALSDLPKPSNDLEAVTAIEKALLSSAVVAYCRSFGGNNGAGIATNQISIKFFTSVDVSLHKTLMEIRNKAVAHSDADIVPVQILDHDQSGLLVVAELPFILADKVSPQVFLKHIDTLLGQIQQKLHNYSDQLRAIPGALGSKVVLTFADLANESVEDRE
jgi:hypothetical protein